MLSPSYDPPLDNPFMALAPHDLQNGLESLLQTYQSSRSALRAWLVVHYAEALCRHPEFEGSDEQRCRYRRLAQQWRWLATGGDDMPGSVSYSEAAR